MAMMPKAKLTTQLALKIFKKCLNKKILFINSFYKAFSLFLAHLFDFDKMVFHYTLSD